MAAARYVGRVLHLTKRELLFSGNPRALLLSDYRSSISKRFVSPRTLCSGSNNHKDREEKEEEIQAADKLKWNINNEEKLTKNAPVGLLFVQGPIGWLMKTVNLWLLVRFFDEKFQEGDFLFGAKQALCTVSTLVSERSFSSMVGLVSDSVIESIREAVQVQDPGPAIEQGEILAAKIKEVALGYLEGDKKQIRIKVAFICSPLNDGLSTQQVGNVKIVRIHNPRLLHYSFRKDCSPTEPGEWLVVALDF